jgi:hypothetical protein
MTTQYDYSAADDYDAKREGWALFECDDGALRIQRLDDPQSCGEEFPAEPPFANDGEAVAHVSRRAGEGSAMHLRAMMLHNTSLEWQE